MRSSLPKPLHPLCGRPMVLHVIGALRELRVDRVVVVVGHKADEVIKTVTELAPAEVQIEFVVQEVQQGTGDAVAVALASMEAPLDDDDVVVVPGDTPLLQPSSLTRLVDLHRSSQSAATLLTASLDDPSGYGRIVRSKDGRVIGVVEHGDATDAQRDIREVNTSIYCFRRSLLAPALRRLSPSNAQGEYYLTDVVGVLSDAGHRLDSLILDDPAEVAGVNDRAQLASAEAVLRRRINDAWMRHGVTMQDPDSTYVDVDVVLGHDVTLRPGVVLRGDTRIDDGCVLGPGCVLDDCQVGPAARLGMVTAERATIGEGAMIGSFVHLPLGASVPPNARVETL